MSALSRDLEVCLIEDGKYHVQRILPEVVRSVKDDLIELIVLQLLCQLVTL